MNMPKPNFSSEDFSAEERMILDRIIKKDGSIRASKPKTDDAIGGDAAYVWRMVCFFVSPKRQHQCMPATAEFDLHTFKEDGKWSSALARKHAKELDSLVDKIVDGVPRGQQHGVNRWQRAFCG